MRFYLLSLYCDVVIDKLLLTVLILFFFKQKTAYEVRISDWSSDVCSSDLVRRSVRRRAWSWRRNKWLARRLWHVFRATWRESYPRRTAVPIGTPPCGAIRFEDDAYRSRGASRSTRRMPRRDCRGPLAQSRGRLRPPRFRPRRTQPNSRHDGAPRSARPTKRRVRKRV